MALVIDECPVCRTKRVQANVLVNALALGDVWWWICTCGISTCETPFLFQREVSRATEGRVVFPALERCLASDAEVSAEIREDFNEAGRALGAGCYRSSMVMSRRALQRLLKEKGCTHHNFVDAIKEAKEKLIIRTAFHEMADEVRKYGNLGGHPDDEQLENCTPEACNDLLDFVEVMIEDVYELPAKAAKLKSRRESPQTP